MVVRVLLVDDAPDIRMLVRAALQLRGGFEVVGEAADGAAAVSMVAEVQPDVIVLDLGLPILAGSEVIPHVRALAPAAKIVVFTSSELTADGFEQRVEGFLRKDVDVQLLVDVLANVAATPFGLAEVVLAPFLESASEARRFTSAQCAEWDCEVIRDDALVVVSELVTNAVVHARSACTLRLLRVPGGIRFEVLDDGAGSPDPQMASSDDEHGRGLLLVGAMSAAWGVASTDDGRKLVWAEMPCSYERAV